MMKKINLFWIIILLTISLVIAINLGVTKIIVDSDLNGSHDVEVSDIDGDGDLDIVADAYLNDSVYWYRQNSPNSWSRFTIDSDLRNAHDIQIGDIDNDGKNDVVGISLSNTSTNYSKPNATLRWYKNPADPTGQWSNTTIEHSGVKSDPGILGARGLELVDLTGDGDLDIIVGIDANTYALTGGLHFFLNPNGTDSTNASKWTRHIISNTVSNIAHIQSADIDKDGNNDIATFEHHKENSGKTNIWWSPYNVTHLTNWTETELSQNDSWDGDIVDFDSDGYLDVLVAHWKSDKYSWYKNPGLEQYWIDVETDKYAVTTNDEILNQSFSNLTISVWVKPKNVNFSGTENRFSRIIDKNTPYQIAPDNQANYIIFQIFNSTGTNFDVFTNVQQWNPGQWYHIVASADNGTMSIYVNGVKQTDTQVYTGNIQTTGDHLYIGTNAGTNRALNGSISELRIWNRSWGSSDILTLYNHGMKPNESLLTNNQIFYLTTRNGTDTVLEDVINGNNATLKQASRDNSFRDMSLWNETVIDSGKAWTNSSMSIEAYDIDNDGDLDLGVNTIPGNAEGSQGFFMWYERTNTAGTAFTRHLIDSNISNTAWAHDITIADVNNDGFGDLIGASASADKVMLYNLSSISALTGNNDTAITIETCGAIKNSLANISGQLGSIGLIITVILIIGILFMIPIIKGDGDSSIDIKMILTGVIVMIFIGVVILLGLSIIGGFCP